MKKMYLISEKMLEELKTAPPPETERNIFNDMHVEGAEKLFDEMSGILKREDLTDAEKIKLYNSKLPTFIEFVKKAKNPSNEQNDSMQEETSSSARELSEINVSATPAETETSDIGYQLQETVPVKYKLKAKILFDKLTKDPNVKWDSKGTFSFKGQPVPNTNIIDLVQDALRSRKMHDPHGWRVFATALKEGNYSRDLVGNIKRWSWMYPSEMYEDLEIAKRNVRTVSKPKRLKQSRSEIDEKHKKRLQRLNWVSY